MEKTDKRAAVKIEPLVKEAYLAFIRNSIGGGSWRNLFALVNGEVKDILNNGELSCAYFVATVLKTFNLIKEVHATVSGAVNDLLLFGWEEAVNPEPGDIIVWTEKIDEKGEGHKHIGFYLGNNEAVSNDSKTGLISKHHLTFGEKDGRPVRTIEKILRYSNWDKIAG